MKNKIGYIFGFKESSQQSNSITISTKTGVSHKFPSKYKNCKDFWCDTIYEGDVSEIYIDPELIISAYEKEYPEWITDNKYETRKFYFSYDISREQYTALFVFGMAMLHASVFQDWESEQVLLDTLEKTVNKNNLFSGNLLEIFDNYNMLMGKCYQDSLKDVLS